MLLTVRQCCNTVLLTVSIPSNGAGNSACKNPADQNDDPQTKGSTGRVSRQVGLAFIRTEAMLLPSTVLGLPYVRVHNF